jgi:hypothetical protein
MASVAYLLSMREKAERCGDSGTYRAITADLRRHGFVDEPVALETAVPEPLETAVPKKGRPKLPRCEHGRIVGRCIECEDDGPVAA